MERKKEKKERNRERKKETAWEHLIVHALHPVSSDLSLWFIVLCIALK